MIRSTSSRPATTTESESGARGLPQKALAAFVELVSTATRPAPPTLCGIRKLAHALQVSADSLVFEQEERGPDEEFRLQFEAFTAFDKDEKKAAKTLLDALILKHQARRWASTS